MYPTQPANLVGRELIYRPPVDHAPSLPIAAGASSRRSSPGSARRAARHGRDIELLTVTFGVRSPTTRILKFPPVQEDCHSLPEVGAFYWTVPAPDIVNSGREEQGSVSVWTSWGVLPPRELCGLTWQYLHRKRARLISASQPSL